MFPLISHLVITCPLLDFACPIRLSDLIFFLSCSAQGESVHGSHELQKNFLPFVIHFTCLATSPLWWAQDQLRFCRLPSSHCESGSDTCWQVSLSSEKVEALGLMLICFISQSVRYSIHATETSFQKQCSFWLLTFYSIYNMLLHFIVRNDGGDPLNWSHNPLIESGITVLKTLVCYGWQKHNYIITI